MADYIDREKLIRDLIDKGFYPAIVKRAIENAPTEDVVPRSEYDKLQERLKREAKCQYDLCGQIVDLKQKVEELTVKLESKQFRCDSCDRIALTSAEHRLCVNQAKQEIAKEILDKIGIAFKKIEPSYIDEYFEVVFEDFTTEFNKIYDEYVNS